MSSIDERTQVKDILWDNYYTLTTTAVEAMEILWGEYNNIVKWLKDEHGQTEVDLLVILTELTQFVGSLPAEDRHKPAMQVYAEWNKK